MQQIELKGFCLEAGIKIVHKAENTEGLAVVIDVLRAFSTTCYLAAAGVHSIWAVDDRAAAHRLKRRFPSALLLGERGGYRMPGSDMGNSPLAVTKGGPWSGRPAIVTTSNGTRGLLAASRTASAITGSFVNAGAIVGYIRHIRPRVVSLVCMGSGGRPTIEDTLCAVYLRARLLGNEVPFQRFRDLVLARGRLAPFRDPDCRDMPIEDLDLCLDVNRFNFVLRAGRGPDGSVALERR